jgi:hypothetical protein
VGPLSVSTRPAAAIDALRCIFSMADTRGCGVIHLRETHPMRKISNRAAARAGSILGLLVVGCCHAGNVKPGDRDYPQENPQPTKFLLLHGKIDATLDLNFRINWRATNPRCAYVVSWIAGAFPPYSAWNPLIVDRRDNSFSVQVPIDGVLPGRCEWRFDGVSFGGPSGFRTTLVAANSLPLRPGQSPNGVALLRCGWKTEPGNVEGERGIRCWWPKEENPDASVSGGILWWHPEARDFEAHFIAESE